MHCPTTSAHRPQAAVSKLSEDPLLCCASQMHSLMRVVCWNVNGLRACCKRRGFTIKQLLESLDAGMRNAVSAACPFS